MGTLSSVDVINQYYDLRLDIFNSSYATLCVEAIERSMDSDDISPFHYKLLHFVLEKISSGNSAQLMSIIVMLKCMNRFGFTAFFNHSAISGSYDQSQLAAYSFVYDGTILESELYKDPHALRISNKTLYLLDVLQKLPIDKMNQFNISQGILDEMSELLLLIYKEYAGMYFKGQKLINQLKRIEY